MHDPNTLAHTIKRPWPSSDQWSKNRRWYWPPLVSIWHVDPEHNVRGQRGDDSCGWFNPPFSAQHWKIIDEMVEWDLKFPFYSSLSIQRRAVQMDPKYSFGQLPPGDCLGYVAAAWGEIKGRLRRSWVLTPGELSEVLSLACNPHDGLRTCLMRDRSEDAGEPVRRFLVCVMRAYLRHHRPWWRHPRWHVHHWSIQVHPWQQLRRAFQRCGECGRHLGYSCVSVRVGNKLMHSECAGGPKPAADAQRMEVA